MEYLASCLNQYIFLKQSYCNIKKGFINTKMKQILQQLENDGYRVVKLGDKHYLLDMLLPLHERLRVFGLFLQLPEQH